MTTPTPDSIERLADDIDAIARLTGTFTLRSGQIATEYFDKYRFEAQPVLLARIAAALAPLVPADTEGQRTEMRYLEIAFDVPLPAATW